MSNIVPKVSIQVLAYNHEHFIRQCLEGIVMQNTNFPFVAIVHDDASTDGTASVIKEYATRYPDIIKPIFETENVYQRNPGDIDRIMAEHSHGEYIGFCEGDDYWTDPNKLQIQVDFLDSHQGYSMCFHSAGTVFDDKTLDTSFNGMSVEDKDYDINELYLSWNVHLASVVYRRKMLVGCPAIDPRIIYSDKIFILQCASVGLVRGIKREMSVYRVHEGGVTHMKSMDRSRKLRKPFFYEYMLEHFKFNSQVKQNVKRNLGIAYYNRMMVEPLFSSKWFIDAWRAFRIYPLFTYHYLTKKI